jgi:hypothetical protein
MRKRHTICPTQQRRDQLQRLKLLRITPINAQEVQKVVRDNLPVDVIFRPPFLQYSKCFGEMLVQRYGLVSQLSNQEILLFDLLFEGKRAFKLFLC